MIWKVLKTAIDQWFQHRSARLGAALAYYSVFSMGPLLLIVTSVAGLFFGADAVRGSLTAQFRSLLGTGPAQAASTAQRPQSERLFSLGERYHAEGNIVVARQYFLRAAQMGLASAAFKLAEPTIHTNLNVSIHED